MVEISDTFKDIQGAEVFLILYLFHLSDWLLQNQMDSGGWQCPTTNLAR